MARGVSTKIRILGESMSIPVACACGRRFKVRDDLAGGKVRCPGCGSGLGVPVPGFNINTSEDGEEEQRPPAPPPSVPTAPPLPPLPPVPPVDLARRIEWLEAENRRLRADVEGVGKRVWTIAIVQIVGFGVMLIALVAGRLGDRGGKVAVASAATSPALVRAYRTEGSSFEPCQLRLLSLLKGANKKVYAGIGGERWLSVLTRDEWTGVTLMKLYSGVRGGNLEGVVYEGWAGEFPAMIRMLENDLDTPNARRVADALRELIPYARADLKPFTRVDPDDTWIDGKGDAARELADRLDKELEPIAEDFKREIDDYFCR